MRARAWRCSARSTSRCSAWWRTWPCDICSNCGHAEHLFGEGGGEKLAAQYGVDLLASLPLSMAIRMQADGGKPTVVADTESQIAMIYQEMARSVGARIALAGLGASAMPTIEIADD